MIIFDRKRALGAYMTADTSPKVGYRPYRQTDPFNAAHLSGVGTYHLNRPFDPWELYPDVHQTAGLAGLGQNHPFKETAWKLSRGGYHTREALHGLGAVPGVDPVFTVTPDGTMAQYADGTLVDLTNGNVYDASGNLATTLSGSDLKAAQAQAKIWIEANPPADIGFKPAPAPTNVATVPPSFVASGTQLFYGVQWASSLGNWQSPSQIIAAIKPVLSQSWGIEIDNSSVPSTIVGQATGFSLTVHTTRDYGKEQDIKGVIDGAIYNAGRQITSSQISLGSGPAGTAGTLSEIVNWTENNALWIGIGAFALLFVLPAPGGRRRR